MYVQYFMYMLSSLCLCGIISSTAVSPVISQRAVALSHPQQSVPSLVGGGLRCLDSPIGWITSWVPKPNLLHEVASEPDTPFFCSSWFENKFYVAVTFHV